VSILPYGLLAIVLLGGANWWQFQRGQLLSEKADAAEKELSAAREEAEQLAKKAEVLASKLHTYRSNYEASARTLAAVANDGCLRSPHPADVGGVLRAATENESRLPGPDSGLRR
jgi:hypothetical protein